MVRTRNCVTFVYYLNNPVLSYLVKKTKIIIKEAEERSKYKYCNSEKYRYSSYLPKSIPLYSNYGISGVICGVI